MVWWTYQHADEKYITTSAYKANGPDEIGFEKGVVVKVLEKKLDGWWRVEYQGRVGWTPGTYLTKLAVRQGDSPFAGIRPEATLTR